MLVGYLIQLFLQIVVSIIGLLPLGSSNTINNFVTPVNSALFAHFAWLNQFFPVAYLGQITASIFSLYVIILSFRVGRWVYGLTPFSGGGGD